MKGKQKHISLGCSNHGFTMIELLVAMVVSLLALAAIYSTFLAQHQSYQVQSETSDMQQNIRAAMYYMQRDIRMAGSDPFVKGIFGFTSGTSTANANDIKFTEDIGDGANGAPDGTLNDNETIRYRLSNGSLIRTTTAMGDQIVARNIDALDFVYLDSSLTPLNSGGGGVSLPLYSQIRSVEITIVAKTNHRLLYGSTNTKSYYNKQDPVPIFVANDRFSRRSLTALVHCRNLGL